MKVPADLTRLSDRVRRLEAQVAAQTCNCWRWLIVIVVLQVLALFR